MKKKLLVLLSSVIAGVGLVGATFAAWAVTDNADPLGIKISPSGISETTDGYSTMVLEWGDKTHFTNISGLTLDTPQEVTLGVKSTVVAITGDTQTGGNLSIRLEDYTTSHVEGAPKLIDNIEVTVSRMVSTVKTPIAGLALGGTTLTANANIPTPVNGDAETLYFTVQIADGVSSAQYNQMQSDVVYLLVDWNKPTGITEVSTTTVFFKADAEKLGGGTPRAYAYKEGTSSLAKNADWPGAVMTSYNSENHIYSIDLEVNKFENIIFSYGDGGLNQTADLAIPAPTAGTPLYNGTTWVANSYSQDDSEPVYYLVGNITGWATQEAYKLTSPYSIEVTVPEGGLVYKVKEVKSNTWYSYSSTDGDAANCSWDNAGDTIIITFNPAGPTYITNAKKA